MHIRTASGRLVNVAALSPDDIDPADIAHALAHLCRFTGHTRTFYSVAQHSWYMSYRVPPSDQRWALLHDAGEAYLGDLSRPVKQAIVGYHDLEASVMAAVCQRFGLAPTMPESVHLADAQLLATEMRDLMTGAQSESAPLPDLIVRPWGSPNEARLSFVARLRQLGIA